MKHLEQLPREERLHVLHPLLDHLASGKHPASIEFRGWRIARVDGGWCNLLYRATSAVSDLACKFTMRDGRDRAAREYGALRALDEAALSIAPKPILLDRERYAQPVVVQTWLEGEANAAPPATEEEWKGLLQHLALVHALTPQRTGVRLQRAILDANSPAEARETVRWQVARIPAEAQPASLRALLRRFEATEFPGWPEAPVALCRVDNNILNYLRRPGPWASVDWEYSGWGDPAFDFAQLATHAAYVDVPPERWEWALEVYNGLVDDPTATLRFQVYYRIMAVWWVARVARYLHEIPAGLDQRLVPWPEDWEANLLDKYEHYLRLAEGLYEP